MEGDRVDGADVAQPGLQPPLKTGVAYFGDGVRHALGGPAYIVALSLLGVGGLARDAHAPVGVAVASTLLIWASPAQAIYFGSLAASVPLPAIALAVCLSAVRFLPMGLALLPMLRSARASLPSQFAAAHLTAVTVWAEGVRQVPAVDPRGRLAYFYGLGIACMGLSALATALGYYLVATLPIGLAAGLLFLSPIYFVVALARNAADATDWLALCLGVLLAPVALWAVGPSFDLLALGLVGGTASWAGGRYLGRQKP